MFIKSVLESINSIGLHHLIWQTIPDIDHSSTKWIFSYVIVTHKFLQLIHISSCCIKSTWQFRYKGVDSFATWRLRYIWDQFRYMCFLQYDFGTCEVPFRYSLSRFLFYAEGLQMLNGCLVCYVKLLMCNWTFFFTVDIKHWSPPTNQRANQHQQKLNKHVTSDVQVYVSEASWKGAACLPHHSAHCEC